METKTVFFAFRGNPMCFVHVLLNSLDMASKGMEGRIVLEGEAVKLVPEMMKKDHFLHKLYQQVKEQQLIIGACNACSNKLGVVEDIQNEGIELIGEMSGHPAMSKYIEQGYTVLIF